jgi:hypothetical protein
VNNQNLIDIITTKFKPNSTQLKVFNLLSDKKWHCRECEGKKIASSQYAGGGGIQGLERGTKNRPGLVIQSSKQYCLTCGTIRLGDYPTDRLRQRWTGETKTSNSASNLPKSLIKQILEFYQYTDI